jgi:kinesin family member 2/24
VKSARRGMRCVARALWTDLYAPSLDRYLRAHGLTRYRDNLKGLDACAVMELTNERLSALGIRDVAEKAKMMKMVREMSRDARVSQNADETIDDDAVDVEDDDNDDDGQANDADDDVHSTVAQADVCENGSASAKVVEMESSPRADVVADASPNGQCAIVSPPTYAPRASKIRVSVRKRPLNAKESSRQERDICTTDNPSELIVWEPKVKVDLSRYVERHAFAFDHVYDECASNDDVYESEVRPLVKFVLSRAYATCFAYGQTGSGKTYTMQPLPGRAARDILRVIHEAADPNHDLASLELWVSAFEIYGGRVFDLLNARRKLRVLEDSKAQMCVVGLREYKVDAPETFDRLVEHSTKARCVGSTGANAESSRSHAILQLVLKKPALDARHEGGFNASEPTSETFGKLSFIDLAGSERGADTTDNDRQTRIEGAEINKSLLALKECIRALDSGQSHVPFRGSKLTEVLRDSFLGDSRTVMIANISPAAGSCEHTLNTLRYADRVKELSRAGGGSGESINVVDAPSLSARISTHLANGARDPRTMAFVPRTSAPATPRKSYSLRMSTVSSLIPSAHLDSESTTKTFSAGSRKSSPGARRSNVPISSTSSPLISEEKNASSMTPEEAERAHDALIDVILSEEDAIIAEHRAHIERSMDVVKTEMEFLARVDKPGSAVDVYVDELDAILAERADDVARLRARVEHFRALLRQEEQLSSRVLTATSKSVHIPIET